MALHSNVLVKSSNDFTVTNGVFVAEASDVGEYEMDCMFNPLYDDACDQGFCIKSARTGRIEPFHYETEIRRGAGEDSEVVAWRFRAVNLNLRHVYVDILND